MRPVGPPRSWTGGRCRRATRRAALTISDQTPLGKVLVHADAAGPHRTAPSGSVGRHGGKTASSRSARVSGSGCSRSRRGRAGPSPAALAGSLPGFVTVVDLTHGRALLRLTGDDAAAGAGQGVRRSTCADDVTPNLARPSARAVAELVTDVVRDDLGDGTRSYLLHCERSSGQYLFDVLVDAGAEFKLEIAGFSTSA